MFWGPSRLVESLVESLVRAFIEDLPGVNWPADAQSTSPVRELDRLNR